MNCSEEQKTKEDYLDTKLQQSQPKSRYIAELHSEEFVDRIYAEIQNGDFYISKQVVPYQKKQSKNGFEEVLRKRLLSQAAAEKQDLERRLHYLGKSINHLQRYERQQSPIQSRSLHKSSEEEAWRRQIEQRGKILEQKKKQIEEIRSKKQAETKEIQKRIEQQKNEKKKQVLVEHLKKIEQRSKKRQEEIKSSNEKYKSLKKQKKLFQRLSENFNEKQFSFLDQKKKRLAEIRNLHRPFEEGQLKEHEEKFMEIRKQKQDLRDRQMKMNRYRSSSHQNVYKSVFYRKNIEQKLEKDHCQAEAKIKRQKIKEFSDLVRENHAPGIDENKRRQIEEYIEKQKRKKEQKIQRDQLLLEKSRQKGISYLEELKNYPKKQKNKLNISTQNIQLKASKTERTEKVEYKNYLTHERVEKNKAKPWIKILQSAEDKQSKALYIQMFAEKKEKQLLRKQQHIRLNMNMNMNKQGDKEEIDQEYFDMIKAKLDLLKTQS